jgi:hypothetical protein
MDASARLDHVRLFIATPAYGGLVTVQYLQSLLAAKARLDALGVRSVVYTIANESLITRARNACVARFLAATLDGQPFTHLAFIDADVGFPEWGLERLLRFGAPFAAAAYPLKGIAWSRLAEQARGGRLGQPDAADLEARACDYALRLEIPTDVRDDFIAVHSVGTGFMCLARPVLETLVARHGDETRYENDITGYDAPGLGYDITGKPQFHALFEAGVDPETRVYMSEDYAFCRRWRALGGTIWVDLRARLSHVGSYRFHGDVTTWLQEIGAIQRA